MCDTVGLQKQPDEEQPCCAIVLQESIILVSCFCYLKCFYKSNNKMCKLYKLQSF